MKLSIIQYNRHQNNKTWYLRTYNERTRKTTYRSLHTSNRVDAERILAKENAKLYGNTLTESPAITKAIDAFLDYTQMTKGDGKTLVNYRTQLMPLQHFFIANKIKVVSDLTTSDANDYICIIKDHKPSTIAQRIKVARIFFNFVIKNWHLDIENPFTKIFSPKIRKSEKSFWIPEQIEAILNAETDAAYRFIFSLMAYAGLRFFEAQKMCYEDIETHTIKVWGKGTKFARIPIGLKMRSEIDRFYTSSKSSQNGLIFDQKEMTNTNTNRRLKKTCEAAGIKFEGNANCHRFRHSFASNLLRNGASVVATQRLLRHSSPTITLSVYSHILKDDLIQAIDSI